MKMNKSRREFLTLGLGLPAAGMALRSEFSGHSANLQTDLQQASSPKLSYRTLGKTGLKVTTVGFGCLLTYDGSVIERAADLGIILFDTARGYQGGNNERMVGVALKRKRKDVILSTKSHGASKQVALEELDTSLRELGTDYLDIWYLHGKSRPEDITDDLLEAQATAKKQGKIRFAGVSTHEGQMQLLPWLAEKGVVDVVLTTYNFAMEKGMDTAIETANKAGLGVVAMKVMAGGFRREKPNDPTQQKLQREGAMLAALKWVIKNPNIHSTIPSMTDMAQLDENLMAMAEPFVAVDEKLLAHQLERISPLYCRMCGKCEDTCPKGLPVADILRCLTYAEGYGQFSLGRESFLALPGEVSRVRCNECSSCAVNCAYGLEVGNRLTRAQEIFA